MFGSPETISPIHSPFAPNHTAPPSLGADHGRSKSTGGTTAGGRTRSDRAAAATDPKPPAAGPAAPPAPEAQTFGPAPAPPSWKHTLPVNAVVLLRDGPCRPPDWRWRLANHLAASGRPPKRYRLDDGVYEVVRYLRRGRQLGDWPTPAPSAQDWRPLSAALATYRLQPERRLELEARILAREDTATIATKCGLDPAVIDTFHDVFFDIRPKLDHQSYVLSVIHGDKGSIFDEIDRPRLIKHQAYFGGPFVLEELLWYFAAAPPAIPKRLTSSSADELQVMQRWLNVHHSVLILTCTPRTAAEQIRYAELSLHPWQRR